MTPAAKSVCYFGYYLYAIGLALIIVPNIFLAIVKLPETNEIWIRVVGVLSVAIGFYYHRTGMQNNVAFFKLTVIARIFVFVAFSSFVLLKYAAAMLAGFGVIDLAGAAWTLWALRK
jgi:hypothetical protein